MPRPKARSAPPALEVEGALLASGAKLRWRPIPRAKAYTIDWLDEDREWATLEYLEGAEAVPAEDGYVHYVDDYKGPTGPGGTYTVAAYFNLNFSGRTLRSSPVVLSPPRPKRSTPQDLARRVKGKAWPPEVKALISRLKWGRHGWATLLPKESAMCLGQRIEVEVRSPALTDATLDLLAVIFENLPKLAARAEKAFADYGGPAALDDDKLKRPRIVIDDSVGVGKSAGRWAMVIGVEGSDYAWHIEFVRSRFKNIWAGD